MAARNRVLAQKSRRPKRGGTCSGVPQFSHRNQSRTSSGGFCSSWRQIGQFGIALSDASTECSADRAVARLFFRAPDGNRDMGRKKSEEKREFSLRRPTDPREQSGKKKRRPAPF